MTESTMRLPNTARLLAFGFAGLCAATPALAHHPMGGTLPATVAQGFLSGIGHPVIGLDHLAALVGVGLIAARFSRGLLLPGAWIAAMAVGTALHAGGVDLPFAEVLVALAVVAIGLAAARRVTLPFPVVALLFAAGGLTHGHALAEAIIGAETGPLAAYLVGLVLVQAAIATGIALAARHIAKGAPLAEPRLRFAGVAVALVGLGALALPALA
jgi:urease accessory protein